MVEMGDKLSSLFAEYRDASPDPEPSASFMPHLWEKIEARRGATASLLLRRWTEAWLLATVTLAILMGAFLIPRFQNPPVYHANYVDVLSAADSANDSAVLPIGEPE